MLSFYKYENCYTIYLKNHIFLWHFNEPSKADKASNRKAFRQKNTNYTLYQTNQSLKDKLVKRKVKTLKEAIYLCIKYVNKKQE